MNCVGGAAAFFEFEQGVDGVGGVWRDMIVVKSESDFWPGVRGKGDGGYRVALLVLVLALGSIVPLTSISFSCCWQRGRSV
jgi:hypothetical protein